MKTNNDYPILENGWLMAPSNVIYGNSAIIQIKNIKSINYFEQQQTTMSETVYTGKWDIVFDETLKWHFENQDEMWVCYQRIMLLMAGEKFEEKKYI